MSHQTKYPDEFKQEAIKLVIQEGYSINQAAAHLGIGRTTLGNWGRRTQKGQGSSTEETDELKRLRKEDRELKMERDILKKAATFFAKESG